MKLDSSLMISISGVRGIVGKGINPESAQRFTAAYALGLERGTVAVGRDSRDSGPPLLSAVFSALTFLGFDVVDLGVVSTPTVEIMVQQLNASGGIIITASHNGPEWNALKFLDGSGEFIREAEVERIKSLVRGDGNLFEEPGRFGSVAANDGADRIHVDKIISLKHIEPEKIAARRFKAVVDCVNGAGSRIVPLLLSELGVETVELFTDINSGFPHVPEPRPENLGELASAVRDQGADIGFACDPDADRLVLVDETGSVCSEEMTLSIAAGFVLDKVKGPVVSNLSTTRLIDDIAAANGVEHYRSKVGEANVIEKMKQTGAVIGGEGNGGVIYPAVHYGRDAMVGIALVLQYLAETGKTLSGMAAELPEYYIIKGKFSFEGDFEELSGKARNMFKGEINLSDGIRIDMESGWVHLRMSNTEPVLRVIAEAGSERETRDIMDRAGKLTV
ncbi:MAG: phosphoglucosamine mutase [Candidatus Krumholzibacteriales bacterium]